MQNNSEIGGARALLSLGTTDTKNATDGAPTQGTEASTPEPAKGDFVAETKEERKYDPATNFADVANSHLGSDPAPIVDSEPHSQGNLPEQGADANPEVGDLMDKASQSLNDAVEAAVMRYVGGTLDPEGELHETEPNSSMHGHEHEHEDVHATDDGDDENSRKRVRIHAEDLLSEYQWDRFLEEEVAAGFERTSPKKQKRKGFSAAPDIDSELEGLEAHSEHDSLVHAAMIGVGELAKQLTLPGPAQPRLHQVPIHVDRREPENAEPVSIDHLAHAASALEGYKPERAHTAYTPRRPLKKLVAPAVDPRDSSVVEPSKYNYSSLENLLQQAAGEACAWYNAQTDMGDRGPRLFSAEEIEIVEHFLRGYCHLKNLSRMDICRRVWTSERPKDNFWESVTKVLPYRSKASVYKHIRRQYHVFRVRAKWTPHEDEYLRKLTETSTTNWKDIGEAMNRMPEDCRDRWRNYIKCGDNRVMNKWSDDEEQSLKNIVMDMITNESHTDKPLLINWTVVSERMNGVRSRIQCRYKWNKLLRRESLSRIAVMPSSTKLWILGQITASNAADADAIDWDYMVHVYHDMHKDKNKIIWTTADFKTAFEKMRVRVRDFKTLPLQVVATKIADAIYQESTDNNASNNATTQKPVNQYEELRPKPFNRRRSAEHEAAVVANAAVAAVSSGVSASDAQQQEYTLWR